MENYGELLWEPSELLKEQANITSYWRWLADEKGLQFASQAELWRWSVTDLNAFWRSLWDFFQIEADGEVGVALNDRQMPGVDWFPGVKLNYAEHVFRHAQSNQPAIIFRSERVQRREVSWHELGENVGALAHSLQKMGVKAGDRVVSYMGNIPETVIAFLACASLGAVWSSCSPDFGTNSVIDRFQQIEPTIFFAVDGYQYNGKLLDRREVVADIQRALPTLQHTILFPYLSGDDNPGSLKNVRLWSECLQEPAPLTFTRLPFMHPLWILYSSGTTGLPKAIVQSQGGILLEHLKQISLDLDVKAGDRFFWFTTTGWMMWNLMVGSLLCGATIILYDGSPAYPDISVLFEYAQEVGITLFGTSAAFIGSCMKLGYAPIQHYSFPALRTLGSTGSPLPPAGFAWVYEQIKSDLWLASISGGTDVCSAFVGGSPLLPVYAGELQTRSLGAKVEAYNEAGQAVIDEVGELVLTEPLPSMPIYLWQDEDRSRYRESYFSVYPGVWRHGDWIRITPRGGAVIYGRSDSTINRMGVRMGSSEIYRVVESFPEVQDSLIIGLELPQGRYYLPLFVVLRAGESLTNELEEQIKQALRKRISPHYVPDEILPIAEVPRTLSGKKVEVPVKKILQGVAWEKAISKDAMANPDSLEVFFQMRERIKLQEEK